MDGDEFPFLTTLPADASSVAGKFNELDTLFLRHFWVEIGESSDSKTPTRNSERCFLRSANVHAPPDNEGTGYRTAGIGVEVATGNGTGSGTTDDRLLGFCDGTNRPPFIVFMVTET